MVLYCAMFCRISLSLVFLLSALGKIRNLRAFTETITDFRFFAYRWSRTLALGCVLAETLCALLLLCGNALLIWGFALAALLLTLFSLALLSTLKRHMRLSCNCFGSTERTISYYDIARNLVLIGCALIGLWTSPALIHLPALDVTVLLIFMGACFVALVTHLDDIIESIIKPFTLTHE